MSFVSWLCPQLLQGQGKWLPDRQKSLQPVCCPTLVLLVASSALIWDKQGKKLHAKLVHQMIFCLSLSSPLAFGVRAYGPIHTTIMSCLAALRCQGLPDLQRPITHAPSKKSRRTQDSGALAILSPLRSSDGSARASYLPPPSRQDSSS